MSAQVFTPETLQELAALQKLARAGEVGEVDAAGACDEIAQRLGYLAMKARPEPVLSPGAAWPFPTGTAPPKQKHKALDLIGTTLDLAVGRAESTGPTGEIDTLYAHPLEWSPSTNWVDGGEIIKRERIMVSPHREPDKWTAAAPDAHAVKSSRWAEGPTPLIAAMRAFVLAKLGDEVSIP